ncbi:MAG: preprotein translocase subunit SecE [Actinobacteria bacterium]|nr:preprotein translocase subunit SecE [Actinomycetota bacterium]
MARNRQRAKDRKQKLHRENVPGSLQHASGEVEGAEAAIVAGADGKPVDAPADEPAAADAPADPVAVDEDDVVLEDARDPDADAAAVEHGRLGTGAGDVALTPDAGKPAGFRVGNFLRACWAELQRVQWPNRRQTGQATAVVLGFVVVAGAFLGLMDVVAQRIVDFII